MGYEVRDECDSGIVDRSRGCVGSVSGPLWPWSAQNSVVAFHIRILDDDHKSHLNAMFSCQNPTFMIIDTES